MDRLDYTKNITSILTDLAERSLLEKKINETGSDVYLILPKGEELVRGIDKKGLFENLSKDFKNNSLFEILREKFGV